MKTRSYHISNFGNMFQPNVSTDSEGYVTIHDSPRYAAATDDQLSEWLDSRSGIVRNAAATEIAERKLQEWRAN